MIDDVTIDTFRPHVGASFDVRLPDGRAWPMVLSRVDATETDDDPRRTRTPFSLIFRPPAGEMIRQGTYPVESAAGTMEIFLVPILPDREGPRIQAIFA